MAVRADSEEMRNSSAITIQMPLTARPVGQCRPKNTPRAVATPLPPWKAKNTG